MNHYRISTGDPEGTSWSIDIDHEKVFTREEFDAIAEEALVYAFEKEHEKRKLAFVHDVEIEFVLEYLKSKGFVASENMTASYYLEPYWNKDDVKSTKLRQWIDRQECEDVPDYLTRKE